MATSCIEDSHVILDINGDRQSLIKLKKGGICESAGEAWEGEVEILANNSELRDAGNANQALSTGDIERMRAEGKTGDEIIAALTASSATFHTKTQYSQEKYKKKKAKKYLSHVSLIRPCARSLTEFYFQKMPMKIGGLRADTLAILLSLANISAGSRTLVVDGVGGLVAGAAIERMGGVGALVNAYVGDKKPSQDIASCFNFADDFIKAIPVGLAQLRDYSTREDPKEAAQAPAPANGPETEPHAAPSNAGSKSNAVPGNASALAAQPSENGMTMPTIADEKTEDDVVQEPQFVEPSAKRVKLNTGAPGSGPPNMSPEERERMFQERREKMQALCQKGFQSCIIACPSASPTSLMRAVLPLLAPSASFSVFSPSIEPLADCLEDLKTSKSALGMQVQESWWREFQVLPGRTHPTMATSGTGGYILSGTTLLAE